MISYISEIKYEDAITVIMKTDVGKLIMDGNSAAIYEQQTENLSEIAAELREKNIYIDIAEKMTTAKIVSAVQKLSDFEMNKKTYKTYKVPVQKANITKNKSNNDLKKNHKKLLLIKRQNQFNARRVEDANKFKK